MDIVAVDCGAGGSIVTKYYITSLSERVYHISHYLYISLIIRREEPEITHADFEILIELVSWRRHSATIAVSHTHQRKHIFVAEVVYECYL